MNVNSGDQGLPGVIEDCAAEPASSFPSLLEAELRHRIGNIFTIFRALVKISAEGAGRVEDLVQDLDGRLDALQNAQSQGFASRVAATASLGYLAESQLAPYLGARAADCCKGPEIKLAEEAASVVSLVLHELTTNAVKHGALSVPGGRIDVSWTVESGELLVEWRESNGPPAHEPQKTGFGLRLIREAVPGHLRGRTDLEFGEAGLVARLALGPEFFRYGLVSSKPVDLAATAAIAAQPGIMPLSGMNVLLAEDDPIIAMDCEDILKRLGASSVLAVTSGAEIEAVLAENEIGFILLDLSLADGPAECRIAPVLERGVPVVAMSGNADEAAARLQGRIGALQKPFSEMALNDAIGNAFERLDGETA